MYIELDIPFENYIYTHILIVDGCTYTYVLYIYIHTPSYSIKIVTFDLPFWGLPHFRTFPNWDELRDSANWWDRSWGRYASSMMSPSTCVARGFPTLQWTHPGSRRGRWVSTKNGLFSGSMLPEGHIMSYPHVGEIPMPFFVAPNLGVFLENAMYHPTFCVHYTRVLTNI